MIIFKFGGASVKNAQSIQNVANILKKYYLEQEIVVVISAMDKTTNALEDLAKYATQNWESETWNQFKKIQNFHYQIIDELFGQNAELIKNEISVFFKELEALAKGIMLLGDYPNRIWDKIMAYGELLSTKIIHAYLQFIDIPCEWKDARQFIITDHQYRQADIIWSLTTEKVKEHLQNVKKGFLIITQGYIGSTVEGITTTLGREGSDYTASILGSILKAEKVVVWKDVQGIMSGDPKKFSDVQKIDYLSYEQAIEMTFYGATVIHPKTIKPLKNNNIPLEVKCFLDPDAVGSWIGIPGHYNHKIPIRILKKNVSVLSIQPKDFSFMDETWTSTVYNYATKAGVKVLLVQSSAISLQLCLEFHATRNKEFENLLNEEFWVTTQNNLILHSLLNCHQPFCFEDTIIMGQKIGKNYHWVAEKEIF